MNTSWTRALAIGGFSALLFGFSACSDVKTKIDCHSVCHRYSDCFDKDYDVDSCENKCENDAEDNDARQKKLDDCDDCIDDKSCTSATFGCATQCAGIVP